MDFLTVMVGFFSFACFWMVHVAAFRRLSQEELLRSLLLTVLLSLVIPVLIMGALMVSNSIHASWHLWACSIILAMAIDGLLCFVYVLCIFGPSETSVRMRLVREIAKGGDDGILLQDLLKRYNAETIVKIRLQRLTGSGDVIEKNGVYTCGREDNVFFVFDTIGSLIKKWIGR